MSNKVVVASAVVLGTVAVAGGVCFGVPQVRNSILNIGKDEPVKEQTTTENKSELEIQVENLTAEIISKNDKILQYETEIATKNARIDELTASETQLKAEIESYKELVGSDANYIEIINDLQTQLTAVTTERDSLQAQVNQLVENNNVLTESVSQLETELAETKELLSKYVATDSVDKLQIASYDGTWYLNGTYEDYFIIKNGAVSRGNDAIQGVIQVQNNEMKMWLNDGTFETITLSNDGASVVLGNGSKYMNYIVNSTTNVFSNILLIAGNYSYSDEQIVLNTDNTISYFNGTSTRYGAYVINAVEKNVAGNVDLVQTITATLNNDDGSQETLSFNIVNDTRSFVLNNKNYTGTFFEQVDLNPDCAETYKTNCLKITAKLVAPVTFTTTNTVSIGYLKSFLPGVTFASSLYPYINGKSSTTAFLLNNTGADITSDVVTFYFQFPKSNNSPVYKFDGVYSIGGVLVDSMVVEEIGDAETGYYWCISDAFKEKYLSEKITKTCDAIPSLVAGNYSADGINFTINEDGTTSSDIDFVGGITFNSESVVAEDLSLGEPTAENTYICNEQTFGLPGEIFGTYDYRYGVFFAVDDNFKNYFEPNVTYNFSAYYSYGSINGTAYSGQFSLSDEEYANVKYLYLNVIFENSPQNESLVNGNIEDIYFAFNLKNVSTENSTRMVPDSEYCLITKGLVSEPVISSFTATAETDGVNIYHNVSVVITETTTSSDGTAVSVDKTLTFKLKNNTEIVGTAEYNGETITLTKVSV